ncbi:alcohol acetyltransferase [Brachybacterium sp. AOP43-C2-M15]|uniref:alcohol acetyltransferase n=1 Tax=Brachybacterium sp. AOP43-C2-M15 TaxID=3457661 RepID=UPI004033DD36
MSPQRHRRRWVRLDNASNIFLAARSDVDTKVFRMSAELDHEVDPALLQQALDATFERFPLYHAVLRRGVFWYYLQDSDLRPVAEEETEHSCAPIYQADRRTLLFRVVHHRRRVSLEVFHALSDGTGALWFLTDLLDAYTRRRFPEGAPGSPEHPDPPPEEVPAGDGAQAAEEVHELTTDSFAHYFRRRRRARRARVSHEEEFSREAAPAVLRVEEAEAVITEGPTAGSPTAGSSPVQEGAAPPPAPWAPAAPPPARRVHRVRGTRTPDHRTRVLELTMPARPVLALAKHEGAAMSMYLTALFFAAIRRTPAGAAGAATLTASVPVNLRQFFPSTSARNFFATITVEHTYGEGDDSLGAVARRLQESFSAEATPEALEEKLHRLIRVERSPFARIVPRPLKDTLLSLVNRANNRSLTVAISNLGRVTLPEPAASHVGRMLFHVSAARPQFCAISHGDLLTISFTSPFVENDHVREYARLLAEAGIEVSLAASRTTEAELAEVGR